MNTDNCVNAEFEITGNKSYEFPFLSRVVTTDETTSGADLELKVNKEVIESLTDSGCYVPAISRIVFDTNVKNGRTILTTILYFADGTRSVVMNSRTDYPVVDEAGNVTIQAKEAGIVYALAKRVLAGKFRSEYSGESFLDMLDYADEYSNTLKDYKTIFSSNMDSLKYDSAGFGNTLSRLVENAYDSKAEAAKKTAEREARKEAHLKMLADAQEKKRQNPALHEVVNNLASVVSKLEEKVDMLADLFVPEEDVEECECDDCDGECECDCHEHHTTGHYVQPDLPFEDEETEGEVKVVIK